MEKLEMNIVFKFEMIFLSFFINSIEHLPLYLPFKEKVRGLVQYRLMYPFERLKIIYPS
jgi:hypothetical protein